MNFCAGTLSAFCPQPNENERFSISGFKKTHLANFTQIDEGIWTQLKAKGKQIDPTVYYKLISAFKVQILQIDFKLTDV